MAVHKSGEDYLEAILMIQEEKGNCRSVDVARRLNVSKPSVSVAMSTLRDEGMIKTDEDGYMEFTPAGLELASEIYARHRLLSKFLIKIGVTESVALEDACKIEHDISRETFHCLQEFVKSKMPEE